MEITLSRDNFKPEYWALYQIFGFQTDRETEVAGFCCFSQKTLLRVWDYTFCADV